MDIQEFRQKYPQYNDMPDEKLSASLHQKYYSDMPYEDFSAKFIGNTHPVAKNVYDAFTMETGRPEPIDTVKPVSDMQSYSQAVNPTVSTVPPKPTTKAITERNLPTIPPPVPDLGKSAYIGVKSSASDFYHLLSNLPGLENVTKEDMKKIANYYQPTPAELSDQTTILQKVAMGLGGVPNAIATYLPATHILGPVAGMAVIDALRNVDKGAWQTLVGGAKGAATGLGLGIAGQMSTVPRQMVAGGALFAGQTALEGGGVKDIVSSGITGAALMAGGQGRQPKVNIADQLPRSVWPYQKTGVAEVPNAPVREAGRMIDVPPAPIRAVPEPPKPQTQRDVMIPQSENDIKATILKKVFEREALLQEEEKIFQTMKTSDFEKGSDAYSYMKDPNENDLLPLREELKILGHTLKDADIMNNTELDLMAYDYRNKTGDNYIDSIMFRNRLRDILYNGEYKSEVNGKDYEELIKSEIDWIQKYSPRAKQPKIEDKVPEPPKPQIFEHPEIKPKGPAREAVKEHIQQIEPKQAVPINTDRYLKTFRASTENFNKGLMTENGIHVAFNKQIANYFMSSTRFSEELYIDKNAKILKYTDIPEKIQNINDWDKYGKLVAKYAKDNGYDGVYSTPPDALSDKGIELTIVNPNIVKTKSQIEVPSISTPLPAPNPTIEPIKIQKSIPTAESPMDWKSESIANKAKIVGLNDKVASHPLFKQLKELIDKEGSRIHGKGYEFNKDTDWQWSYLDYFSEKKDSPVPSLQKKIAKDVGVKLTPNNRFKAWDLGIPEPTAGEQKPETEVQQGMFGKGTTTTADLGGYAPPRGTSKSSYTPPSGLFKMEMPELVELVKGISEGKYPQIKAKLSYRLAVGLFRSSNGTIELKADIFKNPEEAAKILSHEIGHLVDWIPDKDMSRGNILGRIASLKKYMSKLLEEYPDSPNMKLTPKDRARIRKEAERLSKGTGKHTIEIEEEIKRELPLSSEDIIKIMNDVGGEVRKSDKKLYDWFAELSGDEKKSILKEALKGRVPDWVSFKKTVVEGVRTVKKTIYETVDPRQKYREMIINEIKKRRLYQYETIMNELKDLSKTWKPFDESKVHQKYINYRYSGKELYADSISVLFNDPALLQEKAPTYHKAFFAYLERKPEVSKIYEDIQNRYNDRKSVLEQRDILSRQASQKGETLRAANEVKQTTTLSAVGHAIKKALIDENSTLLHEIKKAGREDVRYLLEEKNYIPSEIFHYRNRIDNEVIHPLEAEGIYIEDIGEYVKYRRIATERQDLANPGGHTKETGLEALDKLREKLGDEKYAKLEEAVKQQWKVRQDEVISVLKEANMYSDALMKKVEDNENYATFNILAALEEQFGRGVTGHIYKQIGTHHEVENPFIATVLKDASLIRAARTNIIKRGILDFLGEVGDKITPADTRWNGKYREPIESNNPDLGMITLMTGGKVNAYYVPKEISDTFKYNPREVNIILKSWQAVNIPLKALLVSHNPVWMARNLVRDFMGTVKNIPGLSAHKLAAYYIESFREVGSDVFKGKSSKDIQYMLKNRMVVPDRIFSEVDLSSYDQTNKVMDKVGDSPGKYKHFVVKPFLKLWDELGKMGQFTERWAKVSGYKYLKDVQSEKGYTDARMGHLVRTRIGTPDPYRRGTAQIITNNVFLFSNISKEGWRSSWEAAKENPASYTWKTIKFNVLPKLMVAAAAAGFFGEEIKKIIDGISDYKKSNYNVIPLGLTREGKSIFWQLPQDYTGQVIGGLTWNLINGRIGGKNSILDYGVAQNPYGLNPYISVMDDLAQYYLHGLNPYNDYYGDFILNDNVYKAGGVRAAGDMAKYAFRQLGGQSIYNFKGNSVQEAEGELEKILRYPGANVLGAFLSISDTGHKEQLRNVVQNAQTIEAKKQLELKDRIIEDINSRTKAGQTSSIQNIIPLYQELGKEGLLNPTTSPVQFWHRYNRYASRAKNNIEVDAVIQATTTAEKAALLKHYRATKTKEEYIDILRKLQMEGFLPIKAIQEAK